ncbi:uncharacterized protein, partial [Pyrus communis]|uniref:uncharacterized protein n=1 Tax=Pyrus communis TaxID=23211 RepID=UPI0035C03498
FLFCFLLFLVFVIQEPPLESNPSFYGKTSNNPFADTFPDPLCKLNLKETSDFVKSLPVPRNVTSAQRREGGVSSVTQRRAVEAPPTPGRPVFCFSVGNFSRKSFPSKWDDAEKWLISTSCQESPAHTIKPQSDSTNIFNPKQCEVFAEKSRVTEDKVSKVVSSFQRCVSLNNYQSARAFNGVSTSADVLLKGSGTEEAHHVHHRDAGTEMTPLGSSTTSRCPTLFKCSSPARHNTPANRSGPLALGHSSSTNNTIDIAQLQECLGTQYDSVQSNWSSREEEEVEISKSLRHFEASNPRGERISEIRAAAWEGEENNKCCLRYQREEAKIQAWVNLQSAKAEAQSRKLEVKIQKMSSNLEEKLMKRMAVVHTKAEEWRATARQQHSEQIHKATNNPHKMITNRHNPHFSGHISCGCFPCSNIK